MFEISNETNAAGPSLLASRPMCICEVCANVKKTFDRLAGKKA